MHQERYTDNQIRGKKEKTIRKHQNPIKFSSLQAEVNAKRNIMGTL